MVNPSCLSRAEKAETHTRIINSLYICITTTIYTNIAIKFSDFREYLYKKATITTTQHNNSISLSLS